MSSVGQAVGGIVGGVIGLFVGMPALGAQIGMMIGGAIDPPKGPTINGPRLDDLSVQTSTYGAPIPRNYGTIAQTGNVFWLQGDALTEVQTVTESGGKGGPVTTTKTWSYFATFAVGLCQGPIDGVRRIWIGGQLWYDAGSDDIATIIASNQKSDLFTLYLGTDTQTADPLIQADKGIANTPAYRGLAYIVFDALPLEKYSNSLMGAQVKAEIVKAGSVSGWQIQSSTAYTTATTSAYTSIAYADDLAFYEWTIDAMGVYPAPSNFTIWRTDFSTGARSVYRQVSAPIYGNMAASGYEGYTAKGYGDVNMLVLVSASNPRSLCLVDENGGTSTITPPSGTNYNISSYCLAGNKLAYSFGRTSGSYDQVLAVMDMRTRSTTEYAYPAYVEYAQSIAISDGRIFVIEKTAGIQNLHILDIASGVFIYSDTVANFLSPVVMNAGYFSWSGNPADKYLYLNTDDSVYRMEADTLAVTYVMESPHSLGIPGDLRLFHNISENLLMVRFIPYASGANSYAEVYTRGLVTNNATSLAAIVQAECLTSNILTAGDLDVTALTDTVRGYRVAQLGAIRGALDPLRAAFPFDVVQHGYQIKFVRRGGASVASIPTSALDARAAGASPGVQVTDAREMDLMLPRKVSVNYVDVTREYETNQQSYERINTDAIGERAVDLPIVFSAAEAAQTAEMLTYLYWMERHDVAFVLPQEYDNLEPADVITITGTDATWELRLLSTNTLPDGRIECRTKYNKAAIYTPVARGEEGQSTGGLLTLDGPCVYSLLDIPLMRDDDDTAGFPVAMSGYLSGWPGGILYRSDDSGQTWTDLRAFAPGAVMGYATTSLAAHGGTVYDFSSTLAVRLYSGTLSSVTEAQLFAGQNWFAYGADGRWEIIAARIATLQGDGSYILQDFLRGQHGTEWATGLHAVNDRIVLLSATALSFISVNASSIGSAKTYRAITTGKALDSDTDLAFTYRGVNLECLSPVALTGNRHPSTNDWTLTWTRRSRYAGWRDYVDAALGETSESYEVDIYSDGTYTTLKRTLTASSPTVAYTSAQQVTDFGSNQATLYLKVYQLSATVGRGYALTQSITR